MILKKQITIRIEEPTTDNFKDLSEEMVIPYQSLINLYPSSKRVSSLLLKRL